MQTKSGMSQYFIAYNIPNSQMIFKEYNQINSYLADTTYDNLGRQISQAIDMNRNGEIDAADWLCNVFPVTSPNPCRQPFR